MKTDKDDDEKMFSIGNREKLKRTYIYIYIYMFVCVCICMYVCMYIYQMVLKFGDGCERKVMAGGSSTIIIPKIPNGIIIHIQKWEASNGLATCRFLYWMVVTLNNWMIKHKPMSLLGIIKQENSKGNNNLNPSEGGARGSTNIIFEWEAFLIAFVGIGYVRSHISWRDKRIILYSWRVLKPWRDTRRDNIC